MAAAICPSEVGCSYPLRLRTLASAMGVRLLARGSRGSGLGASSQEDISFCRTTRLSSLQRGVPITG